MSKFINDKTTISKKVERSGSNIQFYVGFVSKEQLEKKLGISCTNVTYDEVGCAIHQMLHDGEYYTILFGKTISYDTYARITNEGIYKIEQFVFNQKPGLWIEMIRN